MSKKTKFNDYLRQYLNLVLAIGQVVVSIILFGNGMDFGAATADGFVNPPIVPASYAFSIWFVIYAATIAYGFYQAHPKQRTNKLLREIGFFSALAFFGTSFWLVLAKYNLVWLSFICISIIFISTLVAFYDINQKKKLKDNEVKFVLIPFSLFAGWISAATFLNFQAALNSTGLANWLMPEKLWTVALLLGLAAVTLLVINKNRYSIIYGLTIVWALVGIMVRNINPETYNPELAMATAAVGLIIAGNLLHKRSLAVPK